ncbi:MAG: hypothetical protein D6692_00730, partial [Planctomycetota bacterium]
MAAAVLSTGLAAAAVFVVNPYQVTAPPGGGGGGGLGATATAYWSMDEASGAAVDATGNGYNLSDNGGDLTQDTSTKIQGAGSRKASTAPTSSTRFIWADTGVNSPTSSFTVWAWVRLTTASTIDYKYIIAKDGEAAGEKAWALYHTDYGTGGKLRLVWSADGSGYTTIAERTRPATGTWFFVAFGYDAAAGQAWLSVDADTRSTSSVGAAYDASSAFTLFGTAGRNSWNVAPGNVDEVGFINGVSLNAAQVSWL